MNKFKNFWKNFFGWLDMDDLALVFFGVIVGGILLMVIALWVGPVEQPYSYEVWRESNELKLQSTKAECVDKIDEYIHQIAPTSALNGIAIFNACEDFDVDIAFVLAQGQIESHYGTRGMASKTHSVFNVYAFDDHKYEDIHPNGKYLHPDASVRPYIELLTTNYLMYGERENQKREVDMFNGYVDKNGNRYASDKGYEAKLMKTYENINNVTRLDSLQQEYNKYKLILGL